MKTVAEQNASLESPLSNNEVSQRVNINTLIARYKKEKAKEKTETVIFVGLASLLVVLTGVLISL